MGVFLQAFANAGWEFPQQMGFFFQYQWENVQRMGKYVANNRKVPSQYPANNGKATKKGNLTSNIEMRLDNDTWGCLPAVLLDSKQLYCDRIL